VYLVSGKKAVHISEGKPKSDTCLRLKGKTWTGWNVERLTGARRAEGEPGKLV
jgi:hypothetical protein